MNCPSYILQVSAVEGCPLSGVPLYLYSDAFFNLQIHYESQLFEICQGAGDVTAISDLLSHGLDVNAFDKAGLHTPYTIICTSLVSRLLPLFSMIHAESLGSVV